MLWCMPISVRILTYEHYINTALHVLHIYTQVAIMDDIKCGNSLVGEVATLSLLFLVSLSCLSPSLMHPQALGHQDKPPAQQPLILD